MLAQKVRDAMSVSVGVAYDDCHKVYILGDWQQVDKMREFGYETLVTTDDCNREELVIKTLEFFHDSCGLRFITHLVTTPEGELFNSIIDQFEEVG
jgi:hypothetical protein